MRHKSPYFRVSLGFVGYCGSDSRLIRCDVSIRDDLNATGYDATISSSATLDGSWQARNASNAMIIDEIGETEDSIGREKFSI